MIDLDITGFPLVALPELALEVGLLPVTRAQFDFYLGDRPRLSPEAFEEMTRTSPRSSWRGPVAEAFESLFVTAIRPDEAAEFAQWLGAGFRLPRDKEWRAIDTALGTFAGKCQPIQAIVSNARLHPAARTILAWSTSRTSTTWRSAGLFENGLLEWVKRSAGGFGLQGRPRTSLLRIVHNPQVHEAIVPRMEERHAAFGFRLVRPLTPRVS